MYVLVAWLALIPAWSHSTPEFHEDFGALNLGTETAQWSSPEALVAQLRSSDPDRRLAAFRLLGMPEAEAHRKIWDSALPPKVVGQEVVTPDHVQLTYAALGTGPTLQAILAVQNSQMTYAAVAIPATRGWTRIALFDCWCKYEMQAGEDTLDDFVHTVMARSPEPVSPHPSELVLRASGGGSGIYVKQEVHFRIRGGKLVPVLSFVSDRRSCPMADPCLLEKRWFTMTDVKGKLTSMLIEARGAFPQTTDTFDPDFAIRELQNRKLRSTTCRPYRWDARAFRYTPVGAWQTCNELRVE